MKAFAILVLSLLFASCSIVQYKTLTKEQLPELGTVGIYKKYLLENTYHPKTVSLLEAPVKLKITQHQVSKRNLFKGKNSNTNIAKDSILLSIEILDKIALIRQLNNNEPFLKYLRKADEYRIVTQVLVNFPDEILNTINSADEVYLIQTKQSTLSLEVRLNNKPIGQVEFASGKIVDFKTSEFCWGMNERRETEIFDLVPPYTQCSKGTYKSALKVEKKNEFKF